MPLALEREVETLEPGLRRRRSRRAGLDTESGHSGIIGPRS